MNEKNSETVIDLFELLGVFIKKIWIVVISTIIGAILAFSYTFFFVKPLYKSSALLYVNNSDISIGSISASITNADLTAAKTLVDTYSVILKSRTVVNEVTRLAGVDYTYEEMLGMVEAKAVNNTEVFSITVTSSDPVEAEKLANLYAEVLPEKITEIVNGSDAKIVDYAVVAAKKSSPSYTKNTAIGALAGFVIAAVIIVIGYLRDDIIHTEDYLTQTYPTIPLLSVIPDLMNSQNGYGYYSSSAKKNESARKAPSTLSTSTVSSGSSPFVIETKTETEDKNNG